MAEYDDKMLELAGELAVAISLAEGGNVEGALPQRIHNPGDLELGDRGYGVEQAKTVYLKADPEADINDHTDGFSALRRECYEILSGGSLVYRPSNTFVELSILWTGGDNPGPWCKIVCSKIQAEPTATLAEWVKSREIIS